MNWLILVPLEGEFRKLEHKYWLELAQLSRPALYTPSTKALVAAMVKAASTSKAGSLKRGKRKHALSFFFFFSLFFISVQDEQVHSKCMLVCGGEMCVCVCVCVRVCVCVCVLGAGGGGWEGWLYS